VLVIADEVMCGSGRCGTWRALEHDGTVPDIMAVGKGLAGGYIPLAATLVRCELGDTIVARQGAILTGHTYSGHTTACAAALAVQRLIQREALVRRVRERGAVLLAELPSVPLPRLSGGARSRTGSSSIRVPGTSAAGRVTP
jgi:adenosylmethionine-8-amino-7-oxononanoate aminotransferase